MNQFPILHVEDDENDRFLIKLAFERAGITNTVIAARDAQEAIDYLAGNREFADRARHPLPCLIILDLKLPGKSGMTVLKWVREQPSLKKLVVIVLSASAQVADIDQAYELGANSFLVKPTTTAKQEALARAIKEYWLTWNHAPAGCDGADKAAMELEKDYAVGKPY